MIELLDASSGESPRIQQWTRLVEATFYDLDLTLGEELLASLDEFVRSGADINRLSQIVSDMCDRKDQWYSEDAIRATFAIANEDCDPASILTKLSDDYDLVKPVELLGLHLEDNRLRSIISQWLLEDRKKDITQLASYARVSNQLDLIVSGLPQTVSSTDWIARYPNELTDPLKALNRSATEAKSIAGQILNKVFPENGDIQKEKEAIQEKLLTIGENTNKANLRDRLQRRLSNLENRTAHPAQVSTERLEHLAEKIYKRADLEYVRRYVEECQALIEQGLKSRYGINLQAENLFLPPKEKLLAGVLELKGKMRGLGLWLICKSVEDPTYDFRKEPANIRFLEGLQKQGVNTEPWLDHTIDLTATCATGEPYRLFFTRRIDDVLLMGLHFDTCLSPHQMNFFSSVANALDINKQVLYAKTESGLVVGRCLFALADNGTILTYHRYAHNPKDMFKEQADRFAQQLAHSMKTVLASSGPVSTLVANQWYDDGPVSGATIFGLENADSPIRAILKTETESNIVNRLSNVLGSEDALKSLLPAILFLDELQQRPDLIPALLDRYGFDPAIPFHARLHLAVLARLTKNHETARQILCSLRINSLPQRLEQFYCLRCGFHQIGSHDDVFGLLIDCNPSIALRVLRTTRPRHVKSDAEETGPNRISALALCYQALRRPLPRSSVARGGK